MKSLRQLQISLAQVTPRDDSPPPSLWRNSLDWSLHVSYESVNCPDWITAWAKVEHLEAQLKSRKITSHGYRSWHWVLRDQETA